MLAKKESERDECQRVITGYKNDKEIMKNTILKSIINKEIVIPKILKTERLSNIY